MPNLQAQMAAAGVERDLRKALGHDQVKVVPRGRNLLILMDVGDEPELIARITQFGPRSFGAGFRSHTGRWDPLPVEGTREDAIEAVVSMLGPYLSPENY